MLGTRGWHYFLGGDAAAAAAVDESGDAEAEEDEDQPEPPAPGPLPVDEVDEHDLCAAAYFGMCMARCSPVSPSSTVCYLSRRHPSTVHVLRSFQTRLLLVGSLDSNTILSCGPLVLTS
jgi:hypothetical protein